MLWRGLVMVFRRLKRTGGRLLRCIVDNIKGLFATNIILDLLRRVEGRGVVISHLLDMISYHRARRHSSAHLWTIVPVIYRPPHSQQLPIDP